MESNESTCSRPSAGSVFVVPGGFLAAPVKLASFQLEAECAGRGVENANAFRHDVFAFLLPGMTATLKVFIFGLCQLASPRRIAVMLTTDISYGRLVQDAPIVFNSERIYYRGRLLPVSDN